MLLYLNYYIITVYGFCDRIVNWIITRYGNRKNFVMNILKDLGISSHQIIRLMVKKRRELADAEEALANAFESAEVRKVNYKNDDIFIEYNNAASKIEKDLKNIERLYKMYKKIGLQ